MSLTANIHQISCKNIGKHYSGDFCMSHLSTCFKCWIHTGETLRVIDVMSQVPDDILLNDPVLGIQCLTALAYEQRFEQAEALLLKWLTRLRETPVAQERQVLQYLQTNLSSFTVLLQTLRGDLSLVSAEKLCHLKQTLDIPSEHQPMLNNIFAYLLYMNGKYEKAQHFAARAYHFSLTAEDWFARAVAILLQCVCDRAQGRFDIAYQSVIRAMRDYECVDNSPAWAVLGLVRSMFEYEVNQLDSAEALLLKARPRLAMSAISDFRVNACVTLARIQACRENYAAAEALLDKLHDVVLRSNDRRWIDYIDHERIRVAMLSGKQGLYAQWRSLPQNHPSEAMGALRSKYCPAVGHVPERTLLMLALQDKDFDAAERALGHLGKICLLQADSFLRVILLSGSAALEFGRANHEQAIVFLNQALHLCQASHLYRALFDEVFGFEEVFRLAQAQNRLDDDVDVLLTQQLAMENFPKPRPLISNILRFNPPHAVFPETGIDPLTDTELKVLELLSQGLSNKEISKRSGIAVTTTKWHLKNIFGKLAASNRVGAVLRAQELQLLSVAGYLMCRMPESLFAFL